MDSSDLHVLYPRSHLFTIRLWMEEPGTREHKVRMQVKHVLSGETYYFRDWVQLVEYLERKIYEANQVGQLGERN